MALKLVTSLTKLISDLLVPIQFAIHNSVDTLVDIVERLLSLRSQVDDGKAVMTQGCG